MLFQPLGTPATPVALRWHCCRLAFQAEGKPKPAEPQHARNTTERVRVPQARCHAEASSTRHRGQRQQHGYTAPVDAGLGPRRSKRTLHLHGAPHHVRHHVWTSTCVRCFKSRTPAPPGCPRQILAVQTGPPWGCTPPFRHRAKNGSLSKSGPKAHAFGQNRPAPKGGPIQSQMSNPKFQQARTTHPSQHPVSRVEVGGVGALVDTAIFEIHIGVTGRRRRRGPVSVYAPTTGRARDTGRGSATVVSIPDRH